MKIKKEHLILLLIIIVGILARMMKFGDTVVGTDVAAFARLGKNLIESGSYTFGENYNMGVFFPPGYPLFIGAMDYFFHDLFFSARMVSFISSIISIPIFYLIGKELHDEESGLFAAFAYAFYPLSIILGVYGNSDALFFCLFFLAVYLFISSLKKESIIIYLPIGIFAGMATITRPEGMFLWLLPFLHFLGFFGKKPSPARMHIKRIIIMLLLFIVILSPYMLFVKDYTGKFALSGKNNIAVLLAELSYDKEYHDIVNAPKNLYDEGAFMLTDDKKELSGWNRSAQRSLLKDYILKDPLKFIRGYKNKIILQIKTMIKLFLPFMLPLLVLFFERDMLRKRTGLIFILFPAVYFFMYPFFVIIERQTFFIVLFPMILSSAGFVLSVSLIKRFSVFCGIGKSRVAAFLEKAIKPVIIVIFIAGSLTYLRFSSFDKVPDPVEHARAAEFIKKEYSAEYEKMNVMSRKPIVSFYSDARFTMLPYAKGRDVVEFAKLYDVDLIVVDERLLSRWDFYDELLYLDKQSKDVELVYEDASDKLIRLFEVRK